VGVGELDFLIYTNGGSSNGTTNTDRTSYYETLPKNQLDLGLYLEADRMAPPWSSPPRTWKTSGRAVKEERRLRGDNQAYGQTSEKNGRVGLRQFRLPPLGHRLHGGPGTPPRSMTVKQFFKTYYAPNNAVLALVGDLDTKGDARPR